MDNEALLSLAVTLTRQAAKAIMAVRARGFDVAYKQDASPVTHADHAAEAIIAEGLRAAAAHIPVVAEEEIAAGHQPEAAESFWLVDPLDGTREFSSGGEDFTVNIGLIRQGRPVLGVVMAPASGELFAGIVGKGAWKWSDQGDRVIQVRIPPVEGVTVLSSQHSKDEIRMASYLGTRKVAAIQHLGSSLKICRIAEGAADLYPRFGRTMEWDTAAGQAVLEAAGGSIRVQEGLPLGYGKPGWDNPNFFCSASPRQD